MLEYLHGQQFLLYGVIISMFASILEGCGFDPWSDQIKESCFCHFPTMHAALRSDSKYGWLIVKIMSTIEIITCKLFFQ